MKPDLRFSNEYFFRGFRKESVRFLNILLDYRARSSSSFLSLILFVCFFKKGMKKRRKGKGRKEGGKKTRSLNEHYVFYWETSKLDSIKFTKFRMASKQGVSFRGSWDPVVVATGASNSCPLSCVLPSCSRQRDNAWRSSEEMGILFVNTLMTDRHLKKKKK